MVLTLTVEPGVERKARRYAQANGTTLDALVQDYLVEIARRKDRRPAFLDVSRRLTEEGAAELRAAQAPFSEIDPDMWK